MIEHITRCREMHDTQKELSNCETSMKNNSWLCSAPNYHGPSKSMEGYGVQLGFQKLKEIYNVDIGSLVHDNDGCSRKIALKFYQNIFEYLDLGHYRKNFKVKIIALGKKYSFLRGLGERLSSYLVSIAKHCKHDYKAFTAFVHGIYDHLIENCSKCIHDESYEHKCKLNFDSNEDAKKELQVILADLEANAKHYAHEYNNNYNESFNNLITKFAPKRLDFQQLYSAQANMAVLQFNQQSDSWRLEVFK